MTQCFHPTASRAEPAETSQPPTQGPATRDYHVLCLLWAGLLGMAMPDAGGLGWRGVHIKGGIEVNILTKRWPAKLQVHHLHGGWATGRDRLVTLDHSGSPGQEPLEHQRWLSSRDLEPTPGSGPCHKEVLIPTDKTPGLVPHTITGPVKVWKT